MSTPKIRFKGFADYWQQRKLKDVAKFIRGSFPQPYTNNDFYDEDFGKPFVQVGDIGMGLSLNADTKAHISKIAESKSRFVKAGTVIVALQGSIEKSIGRTAITQYDAFVDRTILIFEDYMMPIYKLFFAQIIKRLFEKEKEKAWGATISTITKEHLSDFVITLPKLEEQKRIGGLLNNIDNLIILHQRKCDELRKVKKYMLQKMFPKKGEKVPEIRFAGFTGDWEQRKLGSLAEFNPKSILPNKFEYVDLESVMGTEIIAHRTERKDTAPSRAQRLAQVGDVFYQTVRPYQKNNCLFDGSDEPYVFSTGYAQMRPHGDSYFLLTIVQKDDFVNDVLDRCTGTSYPAINSADLSDIVVKYPVDLGEQAKIGKKFRDIDNLIILYQRKCDTLKEIKKYMLQNMFPKK